MNWKAEKREGGRREEVRVGKGRGGRRERESGEERWRGRERRQGKTRIKEE